ncbi:aminotransferase class I/II-fold pyridoxal phosphate-dependent enzyme [Candidatus Saccharibacteria bacterium]|nr:aminotransferase class I/II-fold pyridoxal phosphate-dependent enzyme [Candidatus Saccharibacteria bacterium]
MNPAQKVVFWLTAKGMAFVRRHYLGMAAGYSLEEVCGHTFTVGRQKDCEALTDYLGKRYGGEAILCKNGRSGLCLALKAYFEPGDAVIVNGFTCYAVYEAIKAAGLKPVWADIDRGDLNFDLKNLEKNIDKNTKGIIIQNSLGNPVDIVAIEKFAKKHNLIIIEDLAHCAGVRYSDGREAGTVGAGVAFSFGKDKSIDTVSGGAVVLRAPCKHKIKAPTKSPRPSDHLRARFYPMLGATCRGIMVIRAGGVLMRFLIRIHWVERSADNKLDLTRKISKFEARRALTQFKNLRKSGEPALREFYLVENRDEVLRELRLNRYFFDGLWYEKPVSPERYYKKVHFPEAKCPEAVFISEHIINFPTYYSKDKLVRARKIVEKHLIGGENG